MTPQQRFDSLRNELETRIFVSTKLEAIRQNPVVSELPFFQQFQYVNGTYGPDNAIVQYKEPDSLSRAIAELRAIIADISQFQTVQQAASACYQDSPQLQADTSELLCAVAEIQRTTQYLIDELLRFPQSNLQICQLSQEVDCYYEAVNLLAYARFLQAVPAIAQQIIAAGDCSNGALLYFLGNSVLQCVDCQRLGIYVQLQNTQTKLISELEEQLLRALFSFNVFDQQTIYCVNESPQLAIHELVKRISITRIIISRQSRTNAKVAEFIAQIEAKAADILARSEYIDESFISPDLVPHDAKLSSVEYLFLLAQSVNLAVDDQESFFLGLEYRFNEHFYLLLNYIYQLTLQQQTKAFMKNQEIKVNFPQFTDVSNNILPNLGIPLAIPEMSEKQVNSTVFLRILCSRLYYLIHNAFYFNQALRFTKRQATRVQGFYEFTLAAVTPGGVGIQKLLLMAFEYALEFIRHFCAIDRNIILPQNLIKLRQDGLPLFALHYVSNLPSQAYKATKLDIDTSFYKHSICTLACELPIYGIFNFFSRIGMDQKVRMWDYTARAQSIAELYTVIFDEFYKYYIDHVVMAPFYQSKDSGQLFVIACDQKRLVIEEIYEQANRYLRNIIRFSQEGKIRQKMMYENVVCLIMSYIVDFQNARFANLYSFEQTRLLDWANVELYDFSIHAKLNSLESIDKYYRKLSRGRLSDKLLGQRLILLDLDDFKEALCIKQFLDYLSSQFQDSHELKMVRARNMALIVAEFRLQICYNMFRIKQALSNAVGHCTLMYDLQSCLLFFKRHIATPRLFADIFYYVFEVKQLSSYQARELFDIVKVMNAYVGSLREVIQSLTHRF